MTSRAVSAKSTGSLARRSWIRPACRCGRYSYPSGARAFLQAVEREPAQLGQRQQRLEGERAVMVVGVLRPPGPDEAGGGARARRPRQHRSARRRRDIGHLRRQIGEGYAEPVWQAHDRQVVIRLRQRRAFLAQLGDAREAGEHPHQLALTIEHDPRAAPRRHGQKAGELQRVAQPLLGIDIEGAVRPHPRPATAAAARRAPRAACGRTPSTDLRDRTARHSWRSRAPDRRRRAAPATGPTAPACSMRSAPAPGRNIRPTPDSCRG